MTMVMMISESRNDEICIYSYVFAVKGRPFEVTQLFLEDVLRTTGYANKDMLKYKKEMQRGEFCDLWSL